MTPEQKGLEVAELARRALSEQGAGAALIGALALAAHGFPRSTRDLDLGTFTDPFTSLRQAVEALRAQGLHVDLDLPDGDDPLGGVATISGEDFNDVQIVNFYNPLSSGRNPGAEAIRNATEPLAGTGLKVVSLPYLVALKLYGGGGQALLDCVELLRRNPQTNFAAIEQICGRFGLEKELAALRRRLAED